MHKTVFLYKFVLIFFLSLCGFCCSCSSNETKVKISYEKKYTDNLECISKDMLGNSVQENEWLRTSEIRATKIKGTDIVFFYDFFNSNDFFPLELNSGANKEGCDSVSFGENERVWSIAKTEKNIYFVIGKEAKQKKDAVLREYDLQGRVVREMNLSMFSDAEYVDIVIQESGEIFLAMRDRIVCIDAHWELQRTYMRDNTWISSFFCSDKGVIYGSLVDDVGWLVFEVKSSDFSHEKIYRIDGNTLADDLRVIGSVADNRLIVKMANDLYQYEPGSKKMEKHYSFSGIKVDDEAMWVNHGYLYFIGIDRTQKWKYYRLMYSDSVVDDSVISILVDENLPWGDWIDEVAYAWNVEHNDCTVEVRKANFDLDKDKVLSDLLSENGADIYYIDDDFLSRVISSGTYRDILPLLSTEADFSEKDFYEGPWNSMKNSKGELMFLAPFIKIDALWIKPQKSADTVLTWDKILSVKNEGRCAHLFENNDAGYVCDLFWKSFIIQDISQKRIRDYLDFCKQCETGSDTSGALFTEQVRSGELAYLVDEVGNYGTYLALSEYYGQFPQACYYPELQKVSVISNGYFVVSPYVTKEEEIGRFLMYALSEDALLKDERGSEYTYIRTSSAQKETERFVREYENGKELEDLGVYRDNYTKSQTQIMPTIDENKIVSIDNIKSYRPEGLIRIENPRKGVDYYESLLSEACFVVNDDSALWSLFWEEAQVFFNGYRDLNTTATIIESRMKAYIAEKRK